MKQSFLVKFKFFADDKANPESDSVIGVQTPESLRLTTFALNYIPTYWCSHFGILLDGFSQ